MIRALVFDFGRVFVFPKDEAYFGGLNDLHRVLSESPKYNFRDNFEFNQELLDFILEKQMNLRFGLYLFTKGILQDAPEAQRFLDGHFKAVFNCDKLKLKKSKPNSYSQLAKNMGFKPGELLYIDDDRGNTVAAEMAGLATITFRNNMQFETEIGGYLKNLN